MKNLLSPYPLREKKEKIPILAISWIDHDLFATVNQLSDLLFAQPLKNPSQKRNPYIWRHSFHAVITRNYYRLSRAVGPWRVFVRRFRIA